MQDYDKQVIKTLSDLIHFNTVEAPSAGEGAPFGLGVKAALDYTLDLFDSWGFRTRNLDGYCGWAEVGEGDLFGVLCHLDTVPLGEGWRFDPLSAEIADGKLYGRGSQDDKGPLVASAYALKELLDQGKTPKMRIRFIFGCNEETGWQCMDRYLATEERPVMAISPDGDFPLINCEKGLGHYELILDAPGWLLDIQAGTRVNMVPDKAYALVKGIDAALGDAASHGVDVQRQGDQCVLTATGKAAHGSTPWLGENALVKILSLLVGVDEVATALGKGLSRTNGSAAGVGFSDDQSGSLSFNAGYARMEEGKVHIGLDIRFPISFTHDMVTHGLKGAFPFAEVKLVHSHPCLYLAPDHPLVVNLLDAYEEVMGSRPAPLCVGGATYARALPNAVAFGPVFPGDDEMCHQVDEYVRLDRLVQMRAIYRVALDKICF